MSSTSRAGPAETQVLASSLPPPAAPIPPQSSASSGRRLEALNATSPPSLLPTRTEVSLPPRSQRGTTTTGSSGVTEASSIVGSSNSRNPHHRLTDTTTVSTTATTAVSGSNGTGTTNVGGTGTGGEGFFSPSSTFPMHKRLQRLASSPATNFNNDGFSTAFDLVVVLPNAIQLDGIGSTGNSSNSGAIVHGHTSSIPDSILRTPNSKRADVPSLDGMVPSSPKARSTTSRNRSHSEAIVSHNVTPGASGTGPGPNGRGTTLGDNDDKDTPMMGLTVPTTTATTKRPLHNTKLSSLDNNKQFDKRKALKTTNAQGGSSHATISAIETSGGGASGGGASGGGASGMPLNSGNATTGSPANGSERGRRKPPRTHAGTPTNAAGNNAGTAVVVADSAHRQQQGKGSDAVDLLEGTHDHHQQQHSNHHHPHPTSNIDMSMNVVFAGGGTGGGSSSNSVSSASDHQHHHLSSGPGSIASDVTFDRSRQMMSSGSGGSTGNSIGHTGTGGSGSGTGGSGSGSGSGNGHSNQVPPAPSINSSNTNTNTKPMGAIRSLRFVEVEAPKLLVHQGPGDRPGVAEIDASVGGALGGDLRGGNDMSSVLDHSRFNIGVLDEERAALNDKILQERLLEAKALGRSKTSGATMHKFSLWGGGGGGAAVRSKPADLAINIPNNSTPNSKLPTPSHSHLPPALTSQPNSPAAASVVSGTSSVVTGTTHATNKSMSNSRLRGPLAVREFVQSETFMGIISTSFHAGTDSNDGKSDSKTDESNADSSTSTDARGIKSNDGYAKAERLLPANKPQVNIASNTNSTTKQQPASHAGLATQLRSVVGKAKQLQTSISTGSENLGDIIREAKSSGSKHLISSSSSSSSSSPYEEEQFEDEEEGDEREGGFEEEEEEQEEEEEVIEDDDRVMMPSTEETGHHHHHHHHGGGDGDDHRQSPSGYHGHYDVSESSIMVNRSVDSCADYIEDVLPSDDDDDGKQMIEEVLSDGEIEEEEEMKEQFRRRNVRWSGNSITSENSAVRSSTRSSSARQTSARSSAASVRGGQGLAQEHRKNDTTIGDKTDNKTTGDERMLATAPASMHSCHFLADENEDETENSEHVTMPTKSTTSVRHRNVANLHSQAHGNGSSPIRNKKLNPKNGLKSPIIRAQQQKGQQQQEQHQQQHQQQQPQPHQSESSSSSFLAKEMLLMPLSKPQPRLQSTGHRNGSSNASSKTQAGGVMIMTTPSRPKNANSMVMRQAPNSASAALPSSRPPAEAALDALCSMSMSASASSSPSNIQSKDTTPHPLSLLFQSTSGLTVAGATTTSTTSTTTTPTTTSYGKTPKVFTFNVPPRTRLEEQRSARLERRIAEVQGLGQGQGQGSATAGGSSGGRGHVRSGQGQRTPTHLARQAQGLGLGGGGAAANTPTSSNRHPQRDDSVGYATVAVDGTPSNTTNTTTAATLATVKLFSQTTPLKGALESSLAREYKDNRMGRNVQGPGLGPGVEINSGVSGISATAKSPATVSKSTSATATAIPSSTKQTNSRKVESKYTSQAFSSSTVPTTTATTPVAAASTRAKVGGGVEEMNAMGEVTAADKEYYPMHHETADLQPQPPPPQQQQASLIQPPPPRQSPPPVIHNETTIITSREQNGGRGVATNSVVLVSSTHAENSSLPVSRIPSSESTGDNVIDGRDRDRHDPVSIDNLQDSLSLSVATELSTALLPHGPIITPINHIAPIQGSGTGPLNHVTGRYSDDVMQTDMMGVDVPDPMNATIKGKDVTTASLDVDHISTQGGTTDKVDKSSLKINIGNESRNSTKGTEGGSSSGSGSAHAVHVTGGTDAVAGGGSPKRHSPKPSKRPPSGSAAVEYERNINVGGGRGRGNNYQQQGNNRRNGNNPGTSNQHRQHNNNQKTHGIGKGGSTLVRPLSTPGEGSDGGCGSDMGGVHDHGVTGHTILSSPEGTILPPGAIVSTGERSSPGGERVASQVSSSMDDISDQHHPPHQPQKMRPQGQGHGQGQGQGVVLARTTPLSARSNRSASPALSELSQGSDGEEEESPFGATGLPMRRGIGGAGGIVVRADEKNLRQSMGQGLALGSILRQEETAVATTLTSGMGMGTPAGGLKEDMSGQGHFGQGQGHGYRDSHGTMVDNTDDNRMESNRPARLSHLGADGQGLDPAQGQGLGPALRMTTTPLHLTHNSSVESEVSSVVAEGVGASPLRFRKGQAIGEGTFGRVYKGLNERTGELLAIKQLSLADGTQSEVLLLRKEIQVMWDLDHENIVRYLGTAQSDKYLFIILEYVPGGSIQSMLHQFGAFSESLICRFSNQILSGVDYLHNKGIIHRDIKGSNILVTDSGIAKLADFGCSKQLPGLCTASLEESLRAIRGSVPWMAPEVIKQSGHGRLSDIWSFGATIIEMATGKPPWPEFTNNLAALFHVATSKEPPPIPPHLTPPCATFLQRCLVIDVQMRATAAELLQDVFITTPSPKHHSQSQPHHPSLQDGFLQDNN